MMSADDLDVQTLTLHEELSYSIALFRYYFAFRLKSVVIPAMHMIGLMYSIQGCHLSSSKTIHFIHLVYEYFIKRVATL